MSSNPDQIVAQMHTDFHNLIAYVRDAQTRTATEVERTLLKRLLALGLQLLRSFFSPVLRCDHPPRPPLGLWQAVLRTPLLLRLRRRRGRCRGTFVTVL
jgi:hypothetical protein